MEIVIIRHGDPDYSIDSLTEKGRVEAALLADKISKMDVKAFYCSPLGRAKDTAEYTLKKMNREAEILDWLHEFKGKVQLPNGRVRGSWDIMPSMWANDERYYTDEWCKTELMTTVGNVESEYEIEWKMQTICTFFSRMEKKGLLSIKKNGRYSYYYPVLPFEEYVRREIEQMCRVYFEGNMKQLKKFVRQM